MSRDHFTDQACPGTYRDTARKLEQPRHGLERLARLGFSFAIDSLNEIVGVDTMTTCSDKLSLVTCSSEWVARRQQRDSR